MSKIEIEVTDQRREDMIVGALEGGSNYWYWITKEGCRIIDEVCSDHKEPFSIRLWKAIKAGKSIPVYEYNGSDLGQEALMTKLGEINLKSIEEGEQLMADKSLSHFMDMINENDDATTADVWFQYCLLKEIVYG